MVRARLASAIARAARAAAASRPALASEGRALLAASACKGSGAAAATAVWTSARTNGGFSKWLPAAAFLPAAALMLQDPTVEAAELERTFIAIKPDGVQRGLISEIIGRFERKGYKLVAIKLIVPTKEFAAQHYDDLSSRPFFNGLCDFLSSGPVVAMVWEGQGVIKYGRKLIGATSPQASEPGTIRGDLCVQVSRNIIHGSDGPETAGNEIGLWFKPEELVSYTKNDEKWLYE